MSVSMTRRGLAGAVGSLLAFALVPPIAEAQSGGYANPHLLVSADELMAPAASAPEGAATAYETQGIVLVDVRTAEEYAEGHIPGARHLDPNAVVDPHAPIAGALRSTEAIAEMLGALGLDASTRVVFYDDRGGFHAARMFWLLEYLGHQNAALLNGGLSAWVAAGGALSQEAPAVEARTFGVSPMPRRIATADYLLRHRDDADTVVIDVRPAPMYAEGHIPWAISLPWAGNLTEDKVFLPAEALAERFAAHGVTADRNVVIHCQQGLASAHSYVALRLLGHPQVRVYHRSWSEWGVADDLPKVTGS